jgi:PHD/YefM family antitoxin component YafN of YafNO toxin-antitoxin module
VKEVKTMPTTLHPQYITNATGQRVSVVLPVAEFEELMEDLDDLAAMAERLDEPTISPDELIAGFDFNQDSPTVCPCRVLGA